MISVKLKKAYYEPGKSVLENFQMQVERGEMVAVIGPSGQGKSTLLKIIAGLHRQYEGTVTMAEGARVAFIPQNHCLLPWKTVYQCIVSLYRTQGEQPDREKAMALLEDLGLKGFAKQYPGRLSGGQYQRVALGQAVYCEPALLLMDEPFSNLDTVTKREVQDLYLRVCQKLGMTTVFVTHNLDEAAYMNSRIIELVSP